MKNNQTGATLIIVLLILVAITVIGSLAVRSSILALKVATVGQAQQLMIQNSDAALFNVENPAELARSLAMNGMFGYIKGEDNVGKELVFCFKSGNTQFFNFHNASLISWDGNTVKQDGLGQNGFCKMQSGFFTSGRNTVMTQIAIKAADMSDTQAFHHMQKGTDPESTKKDPAQLYTVYATSIFPALAKSDVTDAQINACFNSRFNGIPATKLAELDIEIQDTNADPDLSESEKTAKLNLLNAAKVTVSSCLTALGVPTHTQVARYALTQTVSK
ncbi:pilus assembly PilX family protein [Acinetobacter indicus]|uniref:pilus assembly PilX family protein n=1 Tax=Acinetobacter indicus TaxID=756892 RepID=UPI000CEC873A|nr:pilus assembly PilX N-terminal domain-containing protein [Acinetobacter indicus]